MTDDVDEVSASTADLDKLYKQQRFTVAVRWMFGETAAAGGICLVLALALSVLGNLAIGWPSKVTAEQVLLAGGWVTAAAMGFTGGYQVMRTEQRGLQVTESKLRSRELHKRSRSDE